ncbi:MAG TPA: methyltransferase, partial [Acidimicrobiales bacterium]|nr:methyltransferase [Acidimicrobiales bacterium]
AYIGHDSLTLAAALPPATGKRVLDLGSGCGVQGLLAARGAAEAVLTDIDKASVVMSALNAALNETPHPVRILTGDLYEPVAGQEFDLVVTLPPYLPTVARSATSAVVSGGRDGLELIRRLVAGTAPHLAPGGELVAVCQLMCSDAGPLLADELADLTGDLSATLIVADWHPLQPFVVQLATLLNAHGAPAPRHELVEDYSDSLRALGVTGVCSAVLRLRRPPAAWSGRAVSVVGRAPSIRPDDVAVPVAGLDIQAAPGLSLVSSPGVAPTVVEGPTAALLAATDGSRTIAEAADAAWGPLPDEDRQDLFDQAVERVGQLAAQGLVGCGVNEPATLR